jgi:hypothetical protein
MNTQETFTQLSQLFPASKIKFRAGATNKEKTRAQALAYIDARDVMERLDMVIGPMGWSDQYQIVRQTPAGVEVECALTINGVTKRDVGTGEDAKSAYSDAFKRAAVKFGVGRYLYDFPKAWVEYDEKRKQLTVTPSLPAWAIPAASPSTSSGQSKNPGRGTNSGKTNQPAAVESTGSDEVRDGVDQLFSKLTRPQQRRLHQVGRLVYGGEWDAKRGEIVAWHTNQRTHSSKDLTGAEAETLIEKLIKKAVKLGLNVPAYQPEDANDILF